MVIPVTDAEAIIDAYRHHNRAPLQIALDLRISFYRVCEVLGLRESAGYIYKRTGRNSKPCKLCNQVKRDEVLRLIRAGVSNNEIARQMHVGHSTVTTMRQSLAEDGLCELPTYRYHPVVQMDMEGNVIAQYPSVQAAIDNSGVPKSSIQKALRGEYKSAGGCLWRYDKEAK